MDDPGYTYDRSLQERAKELKCLYMVDEVLSREGSSLEEVFAGVIAAIPEGLQYPGPTQVKIVWNGRTYTSEGYSESRWRQSARLGRDQDGTGELEVSYAAHMPAADQGPFLDEEVRLIHAIADRLTYYLRENAVDGSEEWRGAVHLLQATDLALYTRLSRRMIRHLCGEGIDEARQILEQTCGLGSGDNCDADNRPGPKMPQHDEYYLTDRAFELAARHLGHTETVRLLQTWLSEERLSSLARTVRNRHSSLSDLTRALRRFAEKPAGDGEVPSAVREGVIVSLIHRFLTDDSQVIRTGKRYLRVRDFLYVAERMIHPVEGTGRVGGKATGLLLAERILQENEKLLQGDFNIKVPRSWYVSSDSLAHLVEYGNLHDWVFGQKYKGIEQVRQEYPLLVEVFKNARFSPDMIKGLSMALDDLRGRPLIVRSSSLGEDQKGTAFSGKYRSLFLANQGSKSARLDALTDAMAEVYASIYSPDPIQYRSEHGLLDFEEEMAILLQEVVGSRHGAYYFPAFSGVALSTNEFRWSPRIERNDGLIRIVPGLGTRAVDRVGDDYPVLVSPGKPALRASTSVDERVRYAPRMIDVIDFEAGSFRTLNLAALFKEPRFSYPSLPLVFSVLENDRLSRPSPVTVDPTRQDLVVTFDGLFEQTTFIKQMAAILNILEDELGTAIDIEFAGDKRDLYVLQCRAQSHSADTSPTPIPRDLSPEDVIFRAARHVSNGQVPAITHIVYVDPEGYDRLEKLADLKAVGSAVSALNGLLPRRSFILMGPGRWGSRGGIKLGVGVTYADINRTAALVEIARRKGGYVPDLSFGTHFFQDLVEAQIRYLPLYPDEEGGFLREEFFTRAPNHLAELAPRFAHLAEVVHVVDVKEATGGRVLRIAMNADENEAVGYLAAP